MSQPEGVTFEEIAKDAVFIAVMGVTGSGKSNFVKLATGSNDAVVGSGLTSCTKKPLIVPAPRFGDKVFLIDTPGFDDTFLSDADVLQEVATCLQIMYDSKVQLRGIIYMHRIIDPRMSHGGMRNLSMFRKLCGPDPMKHVILLTSFWAEPIGQEQVRREEELRTNPDFWAEMIEEGAQMERFDNTEESALALVENLAQRPRMTLQIQKEMCDDGIPLAQTQAGEQVNEELAEMAKKHAEEIRKLHQELQDALKDADKKLEVTLERELTKSEKKLERMRIQQETLKADRRNEMRVLEQEFDRRLRHMEAGKKEEGDAELKQKLADARRQDQLHQIEQKPEKKRDYVKYAKVAGAVSTTALHIGLCVVNPFNAPAAILSFVHLVNLIMSNSNSGSISGQLQGSGMGTGGSSIMETTDISGS